MARAEMSLFLKRDREKWKIVDHEKRGYGIKNKQKDSNNAWIWIIKHGMKINKYIPTYIFCHMDVVG